MDVRLAVAWVDHAGVRHSAGDVVEVDPVTLAELEEHQMVDPEELVDDPAKPAKDESEYIGPGDIKAEGEYIGPGKVETTEYIGPGKVEKTDYIGPGKAE